MEDFRKAMYQACLKADIPILSRDTAAKILAVVLYKAVMKEWFCRQN